MKITPTLFALALITITLYADKNWIQIEPINKTQTSNSKLNINLSQIEPINKMIKNVTVIKQLFDNTKKETPSINSKNWIVLDNTESK